MYLHTAFVVVVAAVAGGVAVAAAWYCARGVCRSSVAFGCGDAGRPYERVLRYLGLLTGAAWGLLAWSHGDHHFVELWGMGATGFAMAVGAAVGAWLGRRVAGGFARGGWATTACGLLAVLAPALAGTALAVQPRETSWRISRCRTLARAGDLDGLRHKLGIGELCLMGALRVALREAEPELALTICREALADEVERTARIGAHALSDLDDPRALDLLLTALDDPREQVRQAATSALGRRPEPAAREALRRLAEGPDPKLAEVAQRILQRE